MESVIAVELKPFPGYKYTCEIKGRCVRLCPSFEPGFWFMAYMTEEGESMSAIDLCTEYEIVETLVKNKYPVWRMMWCMEQSEPFGFNPFVETKVLRRSRYHVYIAHDLDDNLVKIGTTGHLRSRLMALYSSQKHNLVLLGLMQGHRCLEGILLDRFKDHAVRGREWFAAVPDIFEFAKTYSYIPDDSFGLNSINLPETGK